MASYLSKKGFSIKTIGFAATILSLVLGVVFFLFQIRKPITNLRFQVKEEFELIELKEKFPKIKILFNGEDIIKSKKVIKIIRINLVNLGRDILLGYYDSSIPFGLKFVNSKILAVIPISKSKNYLRDHFFRKDNLDAYKKGVVLFNESIIEIDKQIAFKVYLLKEKGSIDTIIKGLGKISGMDEIPVDLFDRDENINNAKSSNTSIIPLLIGYVGVFLLFVTWLTIDAIVSKYSKSERKKSCQNYKKNNNLTQQQIEILDGYMQGWESYYLSIIRSLENTREVLDLTIALPKKTLVDLISDPLGYKFRLKLKKSLIFKWDSLLFEVSDGKISLNPENCDFIISFLKFCGKLKS